MFRHASNPTGRVFDMVGAIAIGAEAIATMLEAMAITRLETIATRLEAIAPIFS